MVADAPQLRDENETVVWRKLEGDQSLIFMSAWDHQKCLAPISPISYFLMSFLM